MPTTCRYLGVNPGYSLLALTLGAASTAAGGRGGPCTSARGPNMVSENSLKGLALGAG
jgi:hypothetical protein